MQFHLVRFRKKSNLIVNESINSKDKKTSDLITTNTGIFMLIIQYESEEKGDNYCDVNLGTI